MRGKDFNYLVFFRQEKKIITRKKNIHNYFVKMHILPRQVVLDGLGWFSASQVVQFTLYTVHCTILLQWREAQASGV